MPVNSQIHLLRCVMVQIWGMIWQTECMARVAPETGKVLGWIDMSGLTAYTRQLAMQDNSDVSQMDVLNVRPSNQRMLDL